MERKKNLESVSQSRRSLLKAMGWGILAIGASLTVLNYNHEISKNTNWAKKQRDKLDRNAVLTIDPHVYLPLREESPIENKGWRHYASEDYNTCLAIKEFTNIGQLTTYYRVKNDNLNGPIMGQKIKRPNYINCQ